MSKPKIVLVADARGWAWERKSMAIKKYLSDFFDFEIRYEPQMRNTDSTADLYLTFDFPGSQKVPAGCKYITGITAHVDWNVWGLSEVRRWASGATCLHANSKLLVNEVKERLGVEPFYVPNGVDHTIFYRDAPRGKFTAGYVGKDQEQKGTDIIKRACELAGVPLKFNASRYYSQDVLSASLMQKWYQDIWVQITCSIKDGTPNQALESAACENINIGNAIGNLPEFINTGVNGFLIERNCDAIVEKLIWCKNNTGSVIEMGRESLKTVLSGWTWEVMALNYKNMFMHALDKTDA